MLYKESKMYLLVYCTTLGTCHFPSGNFPNVQFPKRQHPQAAMAKRCGLDGLGSRAPRLRQTYRLGNCTLGKLSLGKIPLGGCPLGKILWEST